MLMFYEHIDVCTYVEFSEATRLPNSRLFDHLIRSHLVLLDSSTCQDISNYFKHSRWFFKAWSIMVRHLTPRSLPFRLRDQGAGEGLLISFDLRQALRCLIRVFLLLRSFKP